MPGGFLSVLREVRDLLDPARADSDSRAPVPITLEQAQIWDTGVILGPVLVRPCKPMPVSPCCGATLRPGGAVIKPAAASPHLLSTPG